MSEVRTSARHHSAQPGNMQNKRNNHVSHGDLSPCAVLTVLLTFYLLDQLQQQGTSVGMPAHFVHLTLVENHSVDVFGSHNEWLLSLLLVFHLCE